jgi:hypothetical protein
MSRKKYGIEVMRRGYGGKLRFAGRIYLDLDTETGADIMRLFRAEGLSAVIDSGALVMDEAGSYVAYLFWEKRKWNGAIKKKKALETVSFVV